MTAAGDPKQTTQAGPGEESGEQDDEHMPIQDRDAGGRGKGPMSPKQRDHGPERGKGPTTPRT